MAKNWSDIFFVFNQFHRSRYNSALAKFVSNLIWDAYPIFKFMLNWFSMMMPLDTNRRVLMWLCVWPSSQAIGTWKKIGYIVFALNVFGFTAIPVGLDVCLLRMSLRTGSLEISFQAIYQMSVSANTAYACLLIFMLRTKINGIFEKLIKLHDTRKHAFILSIHGISFVLGEWNIWFAYCDVPLDIWIWLKFDWILGITTDHTDDGFGFVLQANQTSEWLCSVYLKYVVVLYFIQMMATGVASVLFGIAIQGQFDVDHAFHPFLFL